MWLLQVCVAVVEVTENKHNLPVQARLLLQKKDRDSSDIFFISRIFQLQSWHPDFAVLL